MNEASLQEFEQQNEVLADETASDSEDLLTHDISASERKIGDNLNYISCDSTSDDKSCFILIDSSILCSVLDTYVNCRGCNNSLTTKVFC